MSKPEDVTLPKGLTTIREALFWDCRSLESIFIPSSVRIIEEFAFEDCTGLRRVDIDDLVSWCRLEFALYDYDPLYLDADLYLNGEIITDIDIVEGEWMFHYAIGSVGRWPSR